MRVLFLNWRDLVHQQAGGAEVVVDRLARGLMERGHEVGLLCGGPVGEHAYRVEAAGGTYGQYLKVPLVYRRLPHPDLVVDSENGIPYFAPLWRRGPSVCLVHHLHRDQWRDRFGGSVSTLGRLLEERLMPVVYRRRLFVSVSPSTAASLGTIGVPADHIRTISLGVDPIPPLPEDGEPLFVCVSRLVPHKRVDLILQAWRTVQPETGGRLVIVGDGPERARLEAMAGPSVRFAGRVTTDERDWLLASAWLMVHAAHHEGWGMVIMEAATAGTPTLAFDAPGVRDAIEPEVTGVLAGSVAELATRWRQLVADAALRHTLGERAQQRARWFSWDRTIDCFESIANEAAGACLLPQ